MLGDTSVGKTCIMLRTTKGEKPKISTLNTVGVELGVRRTEVDGHLVKLNIWDTAGQEKYRAITRSFYRDSQAVMLCYDVTSKDSFLHVRYWLQEITKASEGAEIMIVGNKVDLASRVVSTAAGVALATELDVPFFETSAETGVGVEEAFTALARNLMRRHGITPAAGTPGAGRAARGGAGGVATAGRGGSGVGSSSSSGTPGAAKAGTSSFKVGRVDIMTEEVEPKPAGGGGGCAC